MFGGAQSENAYALGHAHSEIERLTVQAHMFEPFTRQFFVEAGLRSGMRVLDVGSGAGDVAFLAASLVGPSGSVSGIDRAAEAVAVAKARARELVLQNVSFSIGDPIEATFDERFDAIVGRLVLMYYPDPVATLTRLSKLVRPGGIIAFQDFDMYGARSHPTSPLFEWCLQRIVRTFECAGVDTRMGLKLYDAFLTAGLPPPRMRFDAHVGCGKGDVAYFVVAEVVRSLLPLMEKFGVAATAEAQVETLRDRLENEVVDHNGVIVSPSLIGAWVRVD
jgi:SAM-dependent methyltransferase